MADVCTGFEPQNYLRDRCKKCFRPKDRHSEEDETEKPVKKERRRSWKDPKSAASSDNGAPEDASEMDNDLLSVSSYLSANSKGMSSAKSMHSVTSGDDSRSMVTALSGSEGEDDERAPTPTEHGDPSLHRSSKEEVARLREEVRQLKDERQRWTSRVKGSRTEDCDQSLLEMLEERLNEAESCIQDYRDENTVLKCELKELQENTYTAGDTKLAEKLRTTESLCEEMMEENESLKAEVRDLQQEIEEMQDQYREEEIEEFRELQRELELNAKNCRVLQFKLRKSERAREQAESEKGHLENKLQDVLTNSTSDTPISPSDARCRELESELRIAKEVSVRLHNELEQCEEKRYRLEDEVFYLKEKVREIQTQNKWREARNKTETAVKRLSAELSAPPALSDDMSKELRDAIERECDIRDQLKFSEDDLKRTKLRLQDVENENEMLVRKVAKLQSKRPPMVRSASEGNAHIQLELAEHEVEHLSTRCERLEKTNDHLTKKIIALECDSTKRAGEAAASGTGGELTPEMQRDMSAMLSKIADLERKNNELSMAAAKQSLRSSAPIAGPTPSDLRAEQERRRQAEGETQELKATLLKTDNQKLIAMATKVEVLNTQLLLSTERCNNLHKKAIGDGKMASDKYADELKKRVEALEKQLSDLKGKRTIDRLKEGLTEPLEEETEKKVPTIDEIEQCCEVLASVEAQTTRMAKHIEKIESTQKEERRRSLHKDSSATIIAEVASLMKEVKSVHQLLDSVKLSHPAYVRRSPIRETAILGDERCSRCKENETCIDGMREEIVFYKKKNKDLTNQVLQTEDRWTIEIEKQRQVFENEIKSLNSRLTDANRTVNEQGQLIESKSLTLTEKCKTLADAEDRLKRLQTELREKQKSSDASEAEKKAVRELEIKYKKLETIFEQEREKMNTERSRAKTEHVALKKIADDAEELLKKTTDELRRKEGEWRHEKAALDREIVSLKRQLAAHNGDDVNDEQSAEGSAAEADRSETSPKRTVARTESDKVHVIDLRKQIALLEAKSAELEARLEDTKIAHVTCQEELQKTKTLWNKDKEAFQHKTRQTEKIRTVEMDALQQKFSSRMRIMEDTNKSLHSQLVLARRERDMNKEAASMNERRLTEEGKREEEREKTIKEGGVKIHALQKRVNDLEAELERVNTDLRLTKEARKADQIVWSVTDPKNKDKTRPSQSEVRIAESIRKQYNDYETFYSKEVDRLNDRIKEMAKEAKSKQNEMQKVVRDMKEQMRVMEIEQRNLEQAKDNQDQSKEVLVAEQERLQQTVHLSELQKLTRKYRLSSIIDQLQYVTDPMRRNGRMELDHPDGVRYIINQLIAIRDEDASTCFNSELPSAQPSMSDVRAGIQGLQPAPSMSEFGEGTYDNISQSSLSMRSVQSIPVRNTVRWPSGSVSALARQESALNKEIERLEQIAELPPPPQQPSLHSHSMPERDDESKSFSVDSNWAERGKSPGKRVYAEPPSFAINNEKAVEYDSAGRLHYVTAPRRSASFDRNPAEESAIYRNNSGGTNILYQVRREELARGGNPSVRMMARAFESIDNVDQSGKSGFFSMRKSRSVDTSNHRNGRAGPSDGHTLKHTLSEADDTAPPPYATLPRGGRNPFKNMGTKLVERVRRSLSRSGRAASRESEARESCEPPERRQPPKKQDSKNGSNSPKKTKKKAAESKARKTSLAQ